MTVDGHSDGRVPLPRTRTRAIADQLRRKILSGAIPVGSKLRQQEVADRFGVSTSPVREAFAVLEREGLVRRSEHRGAVVCRPTVSDLRENYEIRTLLESRAAELAAERISDDRIQALRALLDEMKRITEPGRYADYNRRFHRLLYEAADSPQLAALIDQLRDAAAAYVQIMAGRQSDTARTHAQHEAIFDAVARHDAPRAASALASHLLHNFDFMLASLNVSVDEATSNGAGELRSETDNTPGATLRDRGVAHG